MFYFKSSLLKKKSGEMVSVFVYPRGGKRQYSLLQKGVCLVSINSRGLAIY